MNSQSTPTVVITDISNRFHYFQWFIYGLMLLDKKQTINLKFQVSTAQHLLLSSFLGLPYRVFNKIVSKLKKNQHIEIKERAYFRGYILVGGKRRSFCIDSADSPNMFNGKLLREVDCYFKMQCPKNFSEKGFLLGNVYVPWFDVAFADAASDGKQRAPRKHCPEVLQYKEKIHPLMVGVRSMGRTASFRSMNACYMNLLSARDVPQTEKAMCYFGNAKGPVPSSDIHDESQIDYDWESDIMGYYGNRMNHPNEKRAKIADILKELGEGYDARIINGGNADAGGEQRQNLIIPLKDFSKHVAKFQYNINVSGYRMSIPNRFVDSFVCGTAIATDNLAVKWYVPFGKEVQEIGEMGYLPDSDVDYDTIKDKLEHLQPIDKNYVIEQYEKYYSPEACARYIVQMLKG